MESKIVVRYSAEEKEELTTLASDLGLSLSAYVRKKTLGKNLKEEYLQLIEKRLNAYKEDDTFTLKKLLDTHWKYLSKAEKKYLVNVVFEAIEEEELPLDFYKITKKGKHKFVKSTGISKVFEEI